MDEIHPTLARGRRKMLLDRLCGPNQKSIALEMIRPSLLQSTYETHCCNFLLLSLKR